MELLVCPSCGKEGNEGETHCVVEGTPLWNPPAYDIYAGTLLDGRYRLLEQIGEGGVGVVYRALHLAIRKNFAVKILHKERGEDFESPGLFQKEAHTISLLDHPNIVRITDFGAHTGVPYLVMELLHGFSLWHVLKQEKRVAKDRALRLFTQMLDALVHAHQRGVIHRDLKSANIFVCNSFASESVKLLDFGLAKVITPEGKDTFISRRGKAFGTASYMSPEQVKGQRISVQTDIYSAGVIAFELFTGKRPFIESDNHKLLQKHLHEAPPAPCSLNASISAPLEGVILKALSKDPAQRFSSAQEFRQSFLAVPEWKESVRKRAFSALAKPGKIGLFSSWEGRKFSATLYKEKPKSFFWGKKLVGVLVLVLALGLLAAFGRGRTSPARSTSEVEALLAQGKFFHAETELNKLVRKKNEPHANYLLGNLYAVRSQWSDMLDAYERAIMQNPALIKDEILLENIGKALQSKTLQRAKAIFLQAGQDAIPVLKEIAVQKDSRAVDANKILQSLKTHDPL